MPAPDDLALLVDAARTAGEIARPFWRANPRVWDKDDGAGPVSEADLAVNSALQSRLRGARPDYGWLSEESEDSVARLTCDSLFIIDPIDGTRAFIEGRSAWSHSLAVATGGRITAAVVHLPVLGKLYAAARGQGATLNDAPIQASRVAEPENSTMLASRPVMAAQHWRFPPGITRHYRPSIAYRLCLVAEARFDAMLALRPTWEWDIAAGALIVTEAGGRITTRTGAPLPFNAPRPQTDGVIAAGAALHQSLLARLA